VPGVSGVDAERSLDADGVRPNDRLPAGHEGRPVSFRRERNP